MNEVPQSPENDACPECGGREWATASDGLGEVASVAATCVSCGYLTASVIDLGSDETDVLARASLADHVEQVQRGHAMDLADAIESISKVAVLKGDLRQPGAAWALGVLGEIAGVGPGWDSDDVARALAASSVGRPTWGTEDYRRYAALFNDIGRAPVSRHVLFSDRHALADHLWEQGWRRDVRPEDVTGTDDHRCDLPTPDGGVLTRWRCLVCGADWIGDTEQGWTRVTPPGRGNAR